MHIPFFSGLNCSIFCNIHLMKTPNQLLVILAFVAIYVIWGSTYLAIAYAIDTIPPFFMAGTRFITTGAILFGWMRLKGIKMPNKQQIKAASISGILMFVGGNVSVVWAEKYISSGVAAIIIASMPLWFVILDIEQLKKLKGNFNLNIGLILGFIGVIILVGINNLFQATLSFEMILSYALLVVATITWAVGTLYTRKASHPTNVTSKVMIQLMASGAVTMFMSFVNGEISEFHMSIVSPISFFAWAYLVVFGTLIAYYSYIWLIQIKPAAQVGTYTYVNPIIAVFLGWWLRDEIISPNIITGLIIILISIFLINYSFIKANRALKRTTETK